MVGITEAGFHRLSGINAVNVYVIFCISVSVEVVKNVDYFLLAVICFDSGVRCQSSYEYYGLESVT